MLRLYSYYRSSTSYRVRIALNLKNLEYDISPINLLKNEHESESFLKINSQGRLPALEIDGEIYNQSMFILEELERLFPSPSIYPKEKDNLKKCNELAYLLATDLHALNNLSTLNYLQENLQTSDKQKTLCIQHWVRKIFTIIEAQIKNITFSDFPFKMPGIFEIMLIPQVYNAIRFQVDMKAFPNIKKIYTAANLLIAFQNAAPENQLDFPKENNQ